jgi:hypothetical protein
VSTPTPAPDRRILVIGNLDDPIDFPEPAADPRTSVLIPTQTTYAVPTVGYVVVERDRDRYGLDCIDMWPTQAEADQEADELRKSSLALNLPGVFAVAAVVLIEDVR